MYQPQRLFQLKDKRYNIIYNNGQKQEIEEFVLSKDWDDVANTLWKKKDQWYYLDFFEQTKWRTDYFGLSPEKFKNVIWED